MAQFKVQSHQEKEWNEKRFVEAILVPIDEHGNEIGESTKISFWNGELKDQNGLYRSTITGELGTNQKGYPVLNTPKQAAGGNFKAMQMDKAMDKKADNIATAQSNKENGIRIASTMSGAVALAVAQFKNEPNDLRTLEELVEYYRRFLWEHWDDTNKFPPF